MKTHLATWSIVVLVTLVPAMLVTSCTVEVQAGPQQQEGIETTIGPDEVDERYKTYGFVFEQYEDHDRYGRFTDHEIDVLGSVIVAYADWVGGPEQLNALVNGLVRVRRDLHEVVSYTQAGKVIGLGRGAFDLALTTESNFYTWGASNGDELAQIVFGHEIGHRWINTLRRQHGVDWGDKYGQNVWRGERASSRETWSTAARSDGDQADPEEEAVTNLALFVLGRGYRWTFLHDAPAREQRQVWIDGWVYDLTANSK